MSSELIDIKEHDRQAVAKSKISGGKVPFIHGNHVKYWATPMQERRGAKPIPQKEWFKMFQPLLLEMANTDEGRELLNIPAECGKIEKFYKNSIHWRTGAIVLGDDGVLQDEWKAEFIPGCKWGNVIRYRWTAFCKLAKTFYERQYRGKKIYRPLLNVGGELIAAHATDTFYADEGDGTSKTDGTDTVDGTVQRAYENQSWSTRRSSAGTAHNDTADAFAMTFMRNYGNTNIVLYVKGISLWDTSSLSGGTVSAAIFKPFLYYGVNNGNFAFGSAFTGDHGVHAYTIATGSTHELANSDYNIATQGTTRLASNDDDWNASFCDGINEATGSGTAAYKNMTATSAGIADINTTGITSWCLRAAWDADNRSEGYFSSSGSQGNWEVYSRSVDHTGATVEAKLEVTYTLPVTDVHAINGITRANIAAVN